MLNRFTIKSRMLITVILTVIFVVTSIFFTYRSFYNTQNNIETLTTQGLLFSSEVQNIEIDLGNLRRYEKDSIINLSDKNELEKYKGKWFASYKNVTDHMNNAQKIALPANKKLIQEMQLTLEEYKRGMNGLYKSIDDGYITDSSTANRSLGTVKGYVHALEGNTTAIVKDAKESATVLVTQTKSEIQNTIVMLLIFSGSALIILIGLTLVIIRTITKPLNHLQDITHRMSHQKEISLPIPSYGKNEINRLADSFKTLLKDIAQFLNRSEEDAKGLVTLGHELSQQTEIMAQAGEQQKQSAETTAELVQQVTEELKHIHIAMENVQSFSAQSAKSAQNGMEVAVVTRHHMHDVNKALEDVTGMIEALNKSANHIGGVVNVIHEIADQTNLLALNAAIEAARAGEAGRGFAVVADEVRKLSERTSKATLEINAMISDVQKYTKNVVQAVEISAERVHSGVRSADQMEVSLTELKEQAQETADKIQEMVDTIEQQYQSNGTITVQMESIVSLNNQTHDAIRMLQQLSSHLHDTAQITLANIQEYH